MVPINRRLGQAYGTQAAGVCQLQTRKLSKLYVAKAATKTSYIMIGATTQVTRRQVGSQLWLPGVAGHQQRLTLCGGADGASGGRTWKCAAPPPCLRHCWSVSCSCTGS